MISKNIGVFVKASRNHVYCVNYVYSMKYFEIYTLMRSDYYHCIGKDWKKVEKIRGSNKVFNASRYFTKITRIFNGAVFNV